MLWLVFLRYCSQPAIAMRLFGNLPATPWVLSITSRSCTPPAKLDRSELHWQFKNVLRQIDDRMTSWETSSELSRFNHAISNRWFSVSEMTAEVAELSLEISRQSAGSFDPTVASLVRLWKFNSPGFTEDALQPPSDEAIAKQLPMVGYHRLQVRRHPPALNKTAEAGIGFFSHRQGIRSRPCGRNFGTTRDHQLSGRGRRRNSSARLEPAGAILAGRRHPSNRRRGHQPHPDHRPAGGSGYIRKLPQFLRGTMENTTPIL